MVARLSGLDILEPGEDSRDNTETWRYPEEVLKNIHTIKEEAIVKLEDATLKESTINLENNIVICETLHIQEELEPMQDEDEIKQEIIELGEYELAENVSVDESKNDEVDLCAVNPPVYKELVIRLEKLDYSSLVKPKSKKNRSVLRRECEHCGQIFVSQYRLAVHRVKEHGSTETPMKSRPEPRMKLARNLHCDQCDKSYHLQSNLATHRAKVHGIGEAPLKDEKPPTHSCQHCKKLFTTWKTLVCHRMNIHGEIIDNTKIVQCSLCKTKFISAEEMAEHHCLNGVVRIRERPFKCDLCDKAYHAKFRLEVHLSSHPEYQNIKCDECPKGFFNEIILNMHKRSMHISEEAFLECLTCNQRFKTKQYLKRHQEVHSDKTPYCCELCGKKYNLRTNFRSHMYKKHQDNLAIPCTICDKTLTGHRGLKLHMRTHNNDRRYKCSFPQCGKAFFTSFGAKRHEKAHAKTGSKE